MTIYLFAIARELAGANCVELDLPANATVGEARKALLTRLPRLADFNAQLRLAVNAEYSEDSMTIPAGADVACIPPVSGG